MKIGIDARPLSHELTGIGRYTLNVITELFKLDDKIEWYLYSDRPLLMSFDCPNVHVRVGRKGSSFKNILFSQCIFPVWAVKDNLDTFWSPRHHLPLALAVVPKIRKVVTVHDIVWKKCPETMSKLGLLLEKLLFKPSVQIASAVIAVSDFTKDELQNEYKTVKQKTFSIPLQSFISKDDAQKVHPKYSTENYILFVGTLEPRKNLQNLLSAFQAISQKKRDIKLIIVGKDGWGDVKVSQLTKSLNIEAKVITTGFVSDEELLSLYQHCTLLVMPSIYEGFGLPALEALSLKKKVIVSKFNAIAGIEGDNVFITELDSTSIATCIEKALETSPCHLAQVGNDWSKIARNTLDILNISTT